MIKHNFDTVTEPHKPLWNMLLVKADLIESMDNIAAFITVMDINRTGKSLGLKRYWGIVASPTITVADVDHICSYGSKWDSLPKTPAMLTWRFVTEK